MKEALSDRILKYLEKKNPRKEVKTTKERPEVTRATPEDELKEAWEDWKSEVETPLTILKYLSLVLIFIVTLWALATVDLQNKCYNDIKCREWINSNK